MPQVTIRRGEKTVQVQQPVGSTLLDAIQAAGVQISMPCGGGGRCGKCLVHAAGQLGAPTVNEHKLLDGQPENMRLACCATVEGDCEATLPEAAEAVVETAYNAWSGAVDPLYAEGYGAAFDIGTTTVAAQLFSRDEKRPLAVLGEMNAQQPYGADVLTRVVYCNEHGIAPLQNLIHTQLSSMLKKLCADTGVSPGEVHSVVVTGNTIMMYIFAGVDPRPLSLAPFTMDEHFGAQQSFTLEGFSHAPVYVPETSSAYIGADITCSILASGIIHAPGNILLIDAGTNGEMALKTDERIVCCSTAAGPTFEGAGIACGGNASVGAIDTVRLVNGQITHTTIGGAPAAKICGSGLIDAVAAMLDAGVLNDSGVMDRQYNKQFTLPGTPVYISQMDVRQTQLAKSAIRAGIDTLLHECGVTYDDLSAIVLCGGFGSYLRPESAERIGLLPPGAAAKTRAIGNAAGNGAGQILQSREKQREATGICARMENVELGTNKFFLDRFMKVMNFDG